LTGRSVSNREWSVQKSDDVSYFAQTGVSDRLRLINTGASPHPPDPKHPRTPADCPPVGWRLSRVMYAYASRAPHYGALSFSGGWSFCILKTLPREKTKTIVIARKLERTLGATYAKATALGVTLGEVERRGCEGGTMIEADTKFEGFGIAGEPMSACGGSAIQLRSIRAGRGNLHRTISGVSA
jgi:hypothetical protein